MTNLRVLIADDEESIRTGLSKLIDWSAQDIQIVGYAQNGKQVLDFIAHTPVDLLITDIRMPIMDGLELSRRLQSNPDTEIIIFSGHGEFAYAQKAIEYGVQEYLLKPVDEERLICSLQRVREKIRQKHQLNTMAEQGKTLLVEKSVEELLTCTLSPEQQSELFRQLRLEQRESLFCVGVLQTFIRNMHVGYAAAIRTNVLRMIRELTSLQAFAPAEVSASFKNDYIFLFCRTPKMEVSRLYQAFALLESNIQQLKLEAILSVGTIVDTPEQIEESRRIALEGLERAFFENLHEFIVWPSLPGTAQSEKLNGVRTWNEDALLNALRLCDREKTNVELDRMFAFLSSGVSSRSTVEALLINTIFKIHQLLNENGAYRSILIGEIDNIQAEITTFRSLHLLHVWMKKLCARTLDKLLVLQDISGYHVAEKVYQLVKHSYADELHLKDIAEKLYFTPDYLGRLFRAAYGIGFHDFLNQQRMNAAKRLLENTGMSVGQVAVAVGFQNADYFTRLFKKQEGVTPSSYRSAARSKGD